MAGLKLPFSLARFSKQPNPAPPYNSIVATISENSGSTYSGLSIATLREFAPTINYNPNGFNTNGHAVNSYGITDRSHVIINASGLANIASANVISSLFRFYPNSDQTGGNFTIVLRKMLVASDVTQVTWNSRLTGIPWSTAGC